MSPQCGQGRLLPQTVQLWGVNRPTPWQRPQGAPSLSRRPPPRQSGQSAVDWPFQQAPQERRPEPPQVSQMGMMPPGFRCLRAPGADA